MTDFKFTKKYKETRREELIQALPASLRKIPIIENTNRHAIDMDEYYSGFEFGVKTSKDLLRLHYKRPQNSYKHNLKEYFYYRIICGGMTILAISIFMVIFAAN